MIKKKRKKIILLKTLCLSLSTLMIIFCASIGSTVSAANGTIVIDPGHDNNDPGCQHFGVNESDVNAQLSRKLGDKLESLGYTVYYTHDTHGILAGKNIILPPMNRKYPILESEGGANSLCGAINKINPDAAICVHHNSFDRDGPQGLEIYWRNNGNSAEIMQKSQHLANLLYNSCQNIYSRGRGVKIGNYKICLAHSPTVLFETGFLSTRVEFNKIVDQNQQHRMADAMAQAIAQFVGIRPQAQPQPQPQFTPIMGGSQTTPEKMARFYQSNSPIPFPSFYANHGLDLNKFCQLYYDVANSEGVRAEIAFCQAINETGWLRFNGSVDISQLNFGGLGATGNGVKGNSFSSVREGILAQIQHLKAYASTQNLNNACVDPRYKYVNKGCSPYLEWLGIKENPKGCGWAASKEYGYKIKNLLNKLLNT